MPEPYYADPQVTLYLGDCRAILPELRIRADCIVTDPPYEETSLPWDHWQDGWLTVAAVVTRSLWCFGSLRMFLAHAGEFASWKLSQDVIWEKHNGSGFAADRFKRVHEQPAHWYRGDWRTVYHDAPREAGGNGRKNIPMRKCNKTRHTGIVGDSVYVDDGMRLVK